MKKFLSVAAFLLAATPAYGETTAKVTPLLAKPFENIVGKEGLMLTVELSPGEASPVHRHNAQVFVYVLEGSVVMQVKGGPETTLTVGQTFYEAPGDIHTVGRNASTKDPAKFLVFMVKDKDAPPVLPAE